MLLSGFRRSVCLLGFVAVLIQHAAAQTTTPIDFNDQIRPILQERCFNCHGPDEGTREAGLRLDLREGAIQELDSGFVAILAGKAHKSELIARVQSDDEDLRMPPPDAGAQLTLAEIEIVSQWINEGANYQEHWSFQPPEVRSPPIHQQANRWARSPIDMFVWQRLREHELSPAEEANRYTLIRRLSLDLTGLPPTREEVRAFLTDLHPDAYARLVDRLLQSPAYGERWARIWLDLARYADSAGYAQDPPRVIWRYRDWVIDALNRNLPYDQFTIEQLAGDMLESPSEDQILATAFHRNTMTNSEGGTDDEEFRTAAVVDRVNTTMQVWMGLTMGCAQCHTHKYDPITQKEYFEFLAIFNNTQDADRSDEAPTLQEYSPSELRQREKLQQEISQLEADLATAEAELKSSVAQSDPGKLPIQFVRIELLRKEYLSLAEVEVFVGDENIALGKTASQSSDSLGGNAGRAVDGNTDGTFGVNSTTHTQQEEQPWWEVDLGQESHLNRIKIWNRTDSPVLERLKPFRVVLLDADRQPRWVQELQHAPDPNVELKVPDDGSGLSDDELARINAYADGQRPELQQLRNTIKERQGQLNAIKGVKTPIMRELATDRQRDTFVQLRGNFLERGEEVQPGVPSAFHEFGHGELNRLTAAHWLVDEENPLTARVAVNRVWEQLFGIGLVETSEDFGTQGDAPSHPDLLDYLANEFVRQEWDTKRLLREIVMSATYRQASGATPEKIEIDPRNRLVSRGPSFRLSAEMIRDQALSIAGLLSRKMKGPSVRPPRPVLGLRSAFGGSTDWETSPGEDRYRRGIYTRWRRTTPYPSMTTFDAPSREVCTIRRVRTNTPLQALVTLNDPVFVEAAQGLARRMLAEGGETNADRVSYGFESCVARTPSDLEVSQLIALYKQVHSDYQENVGEAEKMAFDPLGKPEGDADAVELAAWTVVANVLLNLDELIAKH
ncbi:MAG: hypothetical protein CMJ77_25360 [Planctomycetaceae bacterium]|nr:hypothetical protein [Planctomycetaceae bacterium]